MKLHANPSIIIQITQYTAYIGNNLKVALIKLYNINVSCLGSVKIKDMIRNHKEPENCIFIFLYISHILEIPISPFYIYNLEQLQHFKTEHLLDKKDDYNFLNMAYKKCEKILDYSKINFSKYPKTLQEKWEYLPNALFDDNKINQPLFNKYEKNPYDVLFFGSYSSRRQQIIEHLKKKMDIEIKWVENKFGEELDNLIQNSSLIINLHYSKNSILEISRIHKILQVDYLSLIVSEDIINKKIKHDYKNVIEFVPEINDDLSNINIFIEKIEEMIKLNSINKDRFRSLTNLNDNIIKIHKNLFDNTLIFRNEIFVEKYPYLFHKYKLNIAKSNEDINYKIIFDKRFQSKYYAHLHCYDISKFDEIYQDYINEIVMFFNIVITFSIGKNKRIDSRFVVLKIPNKGMDIGGKFAMVDYLCKNNISCDFIFMLHSKKYREKRNMYFDPFFKNLKKIVMELNNDIGVYVPDIIHGRHCNNWGRNTLYVKELLSFLNIKSDKVTFPEGNCYIINMNLAKILFSNKILYNCLNDDSSFDINWVKNFYNIQSDDMEYIYKSWAKSKLFGNHIHSKLEYQGMPDGQFEHSFERIIFQLCDKHKKKIVILPRY